MSNRNNVKKTATRNHGKTVKGILGAARDFYTGAGVLANRIEAALGDGKNNQEVAPGSFIVLATLHLELLLKALIILHRRQPWGHNVAKLFQELPNGERITIAHLYDTDRSAGNRLGFLDAIDQVKNAFVEWRYAHETRPDKIHVPALKDLIRTLQHRVDFHQSEAATGSSVP